MPPTSPSNSNLQLTGLSVGMQPAGVVQPQKLLFARPTDNQIRLGKILIVDNEKTAGLTIRNHLSKWGFRNFALETNPAAVLTTILESGPDIVILDLQDSMNGLEILQKIRQNPTIQHLPVVIFTDQKSQDVKLRALHASADDFLTKPVDPIELIARVRNTLSNKLMRDQISQYSVELQTDVLTDELTQIANRRAFDYELKRRLIDWRRLRSPLSLFLIDIDYFKLVNDNYGHGAGDRILQNVANTIADTIREMDLVARYGGEEFAVILPNTSMKSAKTSAERIRNKVAELKTNIGDELLSVTVSIGIANSMNGDDMKLIALRADEALYESKRMGRNRSCIHDGAALRLVTQEQAKTPVPQAHRKSRSTDKEAESGVRTQKILAIDDEPSTTLLVRKLLARNGFEDVQTLNDSSQALEAINQEMPDLVLMDIHMPAVNGLQILQQLRGNRKTERLPVVILTSSTDSDIKVKALGMGATDVLHKPVHESELIARVRNTLMAKAHIDALADYNSRLEKHVRLRTAELMASRREAIQVLARAAESRDDSTGQHILRVGRYAAIIAEELGFTQEHITNLEHAAQLHDVGKIAVPDQILKKPGKLTEEEFEFMKRHCTLGSNIIRDAAHPDELTHDQSDVENTFLDDCNSPVMRLAAIVAETHHEKWDGSGYPHGRKGEEIPIEGRITAVADVFDALSTNRCYKDAMLLDECFKTIQKAAGQHFDPMVVEAFMRRRFDIMDVFHSYRDSLPDKQADQ